MFAGNDDAAAAMRLQVFGDSGRELQSAFATAYRLRRCGCAGGAD
jgi:hypothetical protein